MSSHFRKRLHKYTLFSRNRKEKLHFYTISCMQYINLLKIITEMTFVINGIFRLNEKYTLYLLNKIHLS